MTLLDVNFSKKEKRTVILAVTIGNVLEWYEIYLFVYWAPIISKLFFNSDSDLQNLINTYLVFGLGFLSRPLGGILLGRLGDKIGRKKILILSIVLMTIPTFLTGFLPTYATIGAAAPWILGILRFIQAFPAGVELPGACCYLYESSRSPERKYVTSWGSVGFQLGILISTIECYLLESYLPYEALASWGWRVSFMFGGIIGLCGLFLRSSLHETPLFKDMVSHLKIVKEPIVEMFRYKREIIQACFFPLLCSSGFYLFTVNFPVYFGDLLGISYRDSLLILGVILILITVPLPIFGKIAVKHNYKNMLIYSTALMILLLIPLYIGLVQKNIVLISISIFIFCLAYSCMTSLLPYIFCDLFPTRVRFTCVATSFNIADTVVGGFTPALALFLLNRTGNQGSFCWILLACGLFSLWSFLLIKKDKAPI